MIELGWGGPLMEAPKTMTREQQEYLARLNTGWNLLLPTDETIFDSMEEVNTGRNIINSVNVDTDETIKGMIDIIGDIADLFDKMDANISQREVDAIRSQYEKASKEADYKRTQGVVK